MEEQTFTQQITAAQVAIQAARTQLNDAFHMTEAAQLTWKNRQLLTNIRNNLSRHLTVIRKVLLSIDKVFHQNEPLPGLLVSPEGIGTRNWKLARPTIDNADQAD